MGCAYRRTSSPEEAIELLWSRTVQVGDCWEYQGTRNHKGYGQMFSRWFSTSAVHRIAYEAAHGEVPDGLFVLHHCDNPPCVNPAHLFLGTNSDNMVDMLRKGRSPRSGQDNPAAKLTWDDVRVIRASSERPQALSARFGVTVTNIRAIQRGLTWREAAA